MADQFDNKIKHLKLENFTCFSQAKFDFSPGINVIIGENGTGKTHLLKLLYSGLLSLDDKIEKFSGQTVNGVIGNRFHLMLIEIFNTEGVENLKRNEDETLKIVIKSGEDLRFGLDDKFVIDGRLPLNKFKTLYVPPQEMLSWYKGFSSLYLNREVSFDKTYFDLSVALGLGPLKNSTLEKAKILSNQIEKKLNIEVLKKNEKFYVHFLKDNNEHEAAIVAQGINKMAQLIYLINNGSLSSNTVLFWDEPEVSLNPKYITIAAKFIQSLANAGVQLFIASHDYLLVHELSLLSEYRDELEMDGKKVPDIKFFGLYKGKDGSTKVEEGSSMADIKNDAILQEFAAHDRREEALFRIPQEKA